ncbi:alpha/beta hydrolase [Parvibaculaceae bacterium PLY_AMNH_Bact1]|nr:alpha/beta hydrolase [Parvibaculaceae bacterium PLY_AMNH_Bact1]
MKRFETGAAEGSPRIDIGGVDIAYQRWGAGSAIICLHAIGHGVRDFEKLAELVAKDCEIIALDWPGQGRSGQDTEPASAERYAALLEGFVNALGLDQFVLYGNSIGGATAILYADRNPEKVRGLVLSNPGGLAPVDGFARFAIGRMVAFFQAGVDQKRWFSPAFKLYYGRVLLRRAAKAQRKRIVDARFEIAQPLVEAWRSFVTPEADIRSVVRQLKMPVLYAWAARDQIVPLKKSRAAVDTTPDHELVTFRAGHMPAMETPKRFSKVLRGFLERLPE